MKTIRKTTQKDRYGQKEIVATKRINCKGKKVIMPYTVKFHYKRGDE